MYKKLCIGFMIVGIVFLAIMGLMIAFGGNIFGIDFPRNDTAYIGFGIVGFLNLLISFYFWAVSKDKQLLIEDKDERNILIVSKASFIAFLFQNIVLAYSIFILMFMGYLNVASAFTFAGIIISGQLIQLISILYYRKKI